MGSVGKGQSIASRPFFCLQIVFALGSAGCPPAGPALLASQQGRGTLSFPVVLPRVGTLAHGTSPSCVVASGCREEGEGPQRRGKLEEELEPSHPRPPQSRPGFQVHRGSQAPTPQAHIAPRQADVARTCSGTGPMAPIPPPCPSHLTATKGQIMSPEHVDPALPPQDESTHSSSQMGFSFKRHNGDT